MKKTLTSITEGTASNSQSIMQLADQIKKFILKYKENPSISINSLAIGMFLGMSEAFAEDGDSSTSGLNMLDKVIIKMKALAKEYADVVPEEGQDFNLDDSEVESMETTLDDDSQDDSEDDSDMENDDEFATDDLQDEEDGEDRELNMNDKDSDEEDEEEEDDLVAK